MQSLAVQQVPPSDPTATQTLFVHSPEQHSVPVVQAVPAGQSGLHPASCPSAAPVSFLASASWASVAAESFSWASAGRASVDVERESRLASSCRLASDASRACVVASWPPSIEVRLASAVSA